VRLEDDPQVFSICTSANLSSLFTGGQTALREIKLVLTRDTDMFAAQLLLDKHVPDLSAQAATQPL
jgi:hypothetical protein